VLDEITDLSVSDEQRCELVLVCALMVYHDPSFIIWAERWILNIDRLYAAAYAGYAARAASAACAAYAARAACAAYAARAAADAACAAYAARAAEYAACAINLSEIAHDIITRRSR
jgi:hypothetical protein